MSRLRNLHLPYLTPRCLNFGPFFFDHKKNGQNKFSDPKPGRKFVVITKGRWNLNHSFLISTNFLPGFGSEIFTNSKIFFTSLFFSSEFS